MRLYSKHPNALLLCLVLGSLVTVLATNTANVVFSAEVGTAATTAEITITPAIAVPQGDTISVAIGVVRATTANPTCSIAVQSSIDGSLSPVASSVAVTDYTSFTSTWPVVPANNIDGSVLTFTLQSEATTTDKNATIISCSGLFAPYVANPTNGNWIKGVVRIDSTLTMGTSTPVLEIGPFDITSPLTVASMSQVAIASATSTSLSTGNYSDVEVQFRLPAQFRVGDYLQVMLPSTWDITSSIICTANGVTQHVSYGQYDGNNKFFRANLGAPPATVFSPSLTQIISCSRVGAPHDPVARSFGGNATLVRSSDWSERAVIRLLTLPVVVTLASNALGGTTRTLELDPPYFGYTTTVKLTISPIPSINPTFSATLELPYEEFNTTATTTCAVTVNGQPVAGTYVRDETVLKDRLLLHVVLSTTSSAGTLIMTCHDISLVGRVFAARNDVAFQITRPSFLGALNRIAAVRVPRVVPPIIAATNSSAWSVDPVVETSTSLSLALYPVTVEVPSGGVIMFTLTQLGGTVGLNSQGNGDIPCTVTDLAGHQYTVSSSKAMNRSEIVPPKPWETRDSDIWAIITLAETIPKTANLTIVCDDVRNGPVQLSSTTTGYVRIVAPDGTEIGNRPSLNYQGLVAATIPSTGSVAVTVETFGMTNPAAAGEFGTMLVRIPYTFIPLLPGDYLRIQLPGTFKHRLGEATDPSICTFNDEPLNTTTISASTTLYPGKLTLTLSITHDTAVAGNPGSFSSIRCTQITVTPYASPADNQLAIHHYTATGQLRSTGDTVLTAMAIEPAQLGSIESYAEAENPYSGAVGMVKIGFRPMINSLESGDIILIDLVSYAGFAYNQDGQITTCNGTRMGETIPLNVTVSGTFIAIEVLSGVASTYPSGTMLFQCTAIRAPRFSHAGINGVTIITRSTAHNAIREQTFLARALPIKPNTLGSIVRQFSVTNTTANSGPQTLTLSLLPIVNSIAQGGAIVFTLPEGWLASATLTSCVLLTPKSGSATETIQVNGTTTITNELRTITFSLLTGSLPSTTDRVTTLTCSNVSVPALPSPLTTTATIYTRAPNGITVDSTDTAVTPEILTASSSTPATADALEQVITVYTPLPLSQFQLSQIRASYIAQLGSSVSAVTIVGQSFTNTSNPTLTQTTLPFPSFSSSREPSYLRLDESNPASFTPLADQTGYATVRLRIVPSTSTTIPSLSETLLNKQTIILNAVSSSLATTVSPTVSTTFVAVLSTCSNRVKDGTETDVDCGGSCGSCSDYNACGISSDCLSNKCSAGICVPVITSVTTSSASIPSSSVTLVILMALFISLFLKDFGG